MSAIERFCHTLVQLIGLGTLPTDSSYYPAILAVFGAAPSFLLLLALVFRNAFTGRLQPVTQRKRYALVLIATVAWVLNAVLTLGTIGLDGLLDVKPWLEEWLPGWLVTTDIVLWVAFPLSMLVTMLCLYVWPSKFAKRVGKGQYLFTEAARRYRMGGVRHPLLDVAKF